MSEGAGVTVSGLLGLWFIQPQQSCGQLLAHIKDDRYLAQLYDRRARDQRLHIAIVTIDDDFRFFQDLDQWAAHQRHTLGIAAAILMCSQCGSTLVDQFGTENGDGAHWVECCRCGHRGALVGFHVGRLDGDAITARDLERAHKDWDRTEAAMAGRRGQVRPPGSHYPEEVRGALETVRRVAATEDKSDE